jgi:flagellar basal-body rod protein FlgF
MDGIELMAQAMHAARARLDVSASNLANVSTPGFRRAIARATLRAGGLSLSRATDAAPGPLERTGRAFDLALAGAGTFAVRGPGGAIRRERTGSFELDRAGRLVDERGGELLGARGPLQVGADAAIDARGTLRDGAGRVRGQLRLTPGAVVESGFLERTNVDAVREMVDVLSAQRAFETAQTTLSAIDGTRAKAANDVARVAA